MKLVFLYVLVSGYNGGQNRFYRTEMPNLGVCQKMLGSTKINNSHGAESENAVVTWCGGDRIDNVGHYINKYIKIIELKK